jgi:hypothetical protein
MVPLDTVAVLTHESPEQKGDPDATGESPLDGDEHRGGDPASPHFPLHPKKAIDIDGRSKKVTPGRTLAINYYQNIACI